MTDVNEIKGGSYQLVAEQWDKPTSKPGEPFDFVRYRKGDKVDLSAEEARRLVLAGAVVKPGELERAAAEAARLAYEAALALVPDGFRDQLPAPDEATSDQVAAVTDPVTPAVTDPAPPSTQPEGSAPRYVAGQDGTPTRGASKGDWVRFATDASRGEAVLTEDAAGALSRDELADTFLGPKPTS